MGQYVDNVRIYQKKYYEAHKEQIKKRKALWYQKNKKRIDKKHYEWEKKWRIKRRKRKTQSH